MLCVDLYVWGLRKGERLVDGESCGVDRGSGSSWYDEDRVFGGERERGREILEWHSKVERKIVSTFFLVNKKR